MDATVLNNLLMICQILAIAGGGLWFFWRMDRQMTIVQEKQVVTNQRLDKVDTKLENFTEALTQLAKQEVRMNAIDARLQEISNRVDTNTRRGVRK